MTGGQITCVLERVDLGQRVSEETCKDVGEYPDLKNVQLRWSTFRETTAVFTDTGVLARYFSQDLADWASYEEIRRTCASEGNVVDEATLGDIDCNAFAYQEDAQARFLESQPGDFFGLDANMNGVACELLPPQAAPGRVRPQEPLRRRGGRDR